MISRRTLGIAFGVVALLSIGSMFILRPAHPQAPPTRPVMSRADMTRLDNLRQTAIAQHDEVVVLASETRRLSEILAARQVVEVPTPQTPPPHQERIAHHRTPNPGRVAAP